MKVDEGMKPGGNAGRNREIGPSRENNDFSFVMFSAYVKARRAGFSKRDSSWARVTRRYFSRDASKIDILCRSRGKGSTPSSSVAILALTNKNILNHRMIGRTREKEKERRGQRGESLWKRRGGQKEAAG